MQGQAITGEGVARSAWYDLTGRRGESLEVEEREEALLQCGHAGEAYVLTQSFAFLSKATSQGLLQRQFHRLANAGDFGVSQAQELRHALDALTSNEFVMGDHHLSLQVLTDVANEPDHGGLPRLKGLNDNVALARSMLADTGMTVAREDLALEAAYWAQLPGNFPMRPRKAPITSRNFAAMAA